MSLSTRICAGDVVGALGAEGEHMEEKAGADPDDGRDDMDVKKEVVEDHFVHRFKGCGTIRATAPRW